MSNPQPTPGQQVIQFGLFEVDLLSGELRKNGVRVRLQEQPFQVLAQLLGRPGEVVTREELRDRIWPVDTFVDFDHSLNTAINKIRDALNDSASNPRFIETLARRDIALSRPSRFTNRSPQQLRTSVHKINPRAVLFNPAKQRAFIPCWKYPLHIAV